VVLMRMGRPKAALTVSDEERTVLERYVRRGTTAQQLVLRAQIVLGCARGLDNKAVAQQLRTTAQTVGKWRKRFITRPPRWVAR
jgi:FixJ family two-component response regulator